MYFYNYFITLCNEKHVKPSRLALDVGLSKTAVSGWKSGKSLPTDSSLQLLADYFEIPIENFWNCPDIAEKRGMEIEKDSTQSENQMESNYPLREQLRPELRFLYEVAEDAPTSVILEAAAQIMKYKEQNQ